MEKKKFKVIFAPSSQRELDKLPPHVSLKVVKDIKTYLESLPLPLGKPRIKKLKGFKPPCYRLRSGDYRAYYILSEAKVVVLNVVHKKEREKVLKRLRKR